MNTDPNLRLDPELLKRLRVVRHEDMDTYKAVTELGRATAAAGRSLKVWASLITMVVSAGVGAGIYMGGLARQKDLQKVEDRTIVLETKLDSLDKTLARLADLVDRRLGK